MTPVPPLVLEWALTQDVAALPFEERDRLSCAVNMWECETVGLAGEILDLHELESLILSEAAAAIDSAILSDLAAAEPAPVPEEVLEWALSPRGIIPFTSGEVVAAWESAVVGLDLLDLTNGELQSLILSEAAAAGQL